MSDFKEFYTLKKALYEKNSTVTFSRPEILNIILQDAQELKKLENLRYFKKPSTSLDLNLGYEHYRIRHPNHFNANLNVVEHFLMNNNGLSILKHNKIKQKIFTSRSVVKDIMATPYSCSKWGIIGVKFQGNIYFAKKSLHPQKKTKEGTYHFKFQQYCFADSPNESPQIDVPIDESKQTFCVFQNFVKDFMIFYSGEIAGVESDDAVKDIDNPKILNDCRFVITKLIKDTQIQTWRQNHKMLFWWIQAVLGRVDTIYLGFKNKNGVVDEDIENVSVDSLVNNPKWSPDICKTFLMEFLKQVQSIMENVNDPYMIHEFEFAARNKTLQHRKWKADKRNHPFLTETFLKFMENENN